jgi:hypothetical protein
MAVVATHTFMAIMHVQRKVNDATSVPNPIIFPPFASKTRLETKAVVLVLVLVLPQSTMSRKAMRRMLRFSGMYQFWRTVAMMSMCSW